MHDDTVLQVYPNPYAHLDHKGRLAGACSREAEHDVRPGDRRWVGASLDAEKCSGKERGAGDIRSPATDVVFTFETTKQRVPDTKHARDRIREGSLIVADEETAEAIGVRYEDPRAVLARARAGALHTWKEHAPRRRAAFLSDPPYTPTDLPALELAESEEPEQHLAKGDALVERLVKAGVLEPASSDPVVPAPEATAPATPHALAAQRAIDEAAGEDLPPVLEAPASEPAVAPHDAATHKD